jgi:hypothetical protein
MKRKSIKYSILFTVLFTIVLGIKAYNYSNTSLLLIQNLEAINEPIESQNDFTIVCDHNYSCPCMVRCPRCETLIEKINDYGAGTLYGSCPVCGHSLEQ